MKKNFTKQEIKDAGIEELRELIMRNEGDLVHIVAQAFYGNRTATEVRKENIDKFICGHLSDEITVYDKDGNPVVHEIPFTRKVDRSIIRIPGTENLVMVYNKYQEEKSLKDKEEAFRKHGYVYKPLAVIPELGIELYSRCIVCRMNENGELESLQKGDTQKFMKYLAM